MHAKMSTKRTFSPFACLAVQEAIFGLLRPTEGRRGPGGLGQSAFRKKFEKLLAEAD
eukprot:NODE_4586_length_786_cov_7.217096_g3811_i0.p3 GENE.NODE_4586_length_786_cov_7.217096_g3811_i0~~NODE_4586_length_786_cov_7.217096_g3811_i0.p3  ORF type:complete len:57 (-),score=6.98 NODE_4586_length_786_cov_7.217096_g3811_i0:344-514(-)